MAYANDTRSPLEQIRRYVANATNLGKQVDLHVFPGGHRDHTSQSRIRQMELILDFCQHTTKPEKRPITATSGRRP